MNGGKMNQITNQNELLIGRLGRDPELKYTAKQEPICFLSIAINQQDAPATWKKIIVWGKQAELCKLYLTKGKSVFVQGQKQMKSFVNDEGLEKSYEEFAAKLIGFTNL